MKQHLPVWFHNRCLDEITNFGHQKTWTFVFPLRQICLDLPLVRLRTILRKVTHLVAVIALDLGHIQVPRLSLFRSVRLTTTLWLAFTIAFVGLSAALRVV